MTGPTAATPQTTGTNTMGQSANLGDILERVLDKGIVIVGDIKVNLLDIELLTIKLRLLVASVETARQLGIDWWQHDPWLTSDARPAAEGTTRTPLAGARREAIADSDHVANERFPQEPITQERYPEEPDDA